MLSSKDLPDITLVIMAVAVGSVVSDSVSDSELCHPGQKFQYPKKKYGLSDKYCQAQWFQDYPAIYFLWF